MNYRITCLTPTLVGDGNKLSPIDYMVWKDHVNVLDQRRIFQLLSRGSRLEGYLTQIKRADKLDFASWGGFAQNYSDRRIPFEHPSSAAFWEREKGEQLFIPTFANGVLGPYLPGSAIKGALRTAYAFSRWTEKTSQDVLARMNAERPPRRPAELAEETQIGRGGSDRLRTFGVSDSKGLPTSALRVYLLRVSTLVQQTGKLALGWKQTPRGSVSGPDQSTPIFAEMASPGSAFEGQWRENQFLATPAISQSLRWREPLKDAALFASANAYAEQMLMLHQQYATQAGLTLLGGQVGQLLERVKECRDTANGCIVPLGWGTGFFGKSSLTDPEGTTAREILKKLPYYQRAIQSGLPFPKTRKIVFLQNQPATLPGWVHLQIG